MIWGEETIFPKGFFYNYFLFFLFPLTTQLFCIKKKMSNYDEGTQDFDIFDDTPANEYVDPQRSKFTFTPCTRFANLMINSQSNGNGRVRSFTGEGTVSDFNEKLMRGLYGDKGIVEESRPKNLDMVVGGDRISFLDKRKVSFYCISNNRKYAYN